MNSKPVSLQLFNRLTKYLYFLEAFEEGEIPEYISATTIAKDLNYNDVQVRKDLASVSSGGKPKVGYVTRDLICDLTSFLGHDNETDAVLAGAGNLGRALMNYENFNNYGLNIVAAFDLADKVSEAQGFFKNKKVLSFDKMGDLCKRLGIKIGIITVPAEFAQEVCDIMVANGVRAIWNFAPINLKIPDYVVIKNEDMAASLALLIKRLKRKEDTKIRLEAGLKVD